MTSTTRNIVIVGGEGDLALRKLYPALFSLDAAGMLSDGFKIIAFCRGKYNDSDLRERVIEGIRDSEYIASASQEELDHFTQRVLQFVGDATSLESLTNLSGLYEAEEWIFYLATPPSIFSPICLALSQSGLNQPPSRIVIEKPLGESAESFEKIDNDIKSIFEESQIYRIDHYLGKETVQNLLALRFANVLFEPLWNRHYIDHIQITVAESVGIGGRWAFYNEAGAMRDMMQNHLLQLLCLVSMEPPAKNNADFVRDEKLKVLRSLKPIVGHDVETLTVRGQYTGSRDNCDGIVLGYNDEADAKSHSETETFVAVKVEIENARWQGVPFYLRTGKRLNQRYSEIVIQFKSISHKFFESSSGALADNQLIIRLQPNEGIELKLVNKVPGLTEQTRLQSAGLDLSFATEFEKHRSPSAYERLLLDVTRSDQTLFMRSDELKAAWQWVDGILDGWARNQQPVEYYKAGSWGPSGSVDLLAKDRRRWIDFDEL